MNAVRRTAVLLGLTAAVVVAGSIPALASFSATSAPVAARISTLTVAPPTGLVVEDSCTTVTTTVQETVHTDPVTGARTTTYYDSTTSRDPSTSNVESTSSQTVAGPGPNESTTTTVTKNTELNASLSWVASSTAGVTGYTVSARLGNGVVTPLLTTGSGTTSVSQVQDADVTAYLPRLLVTTQTSYRWTADSALTRVLAC